MAFMEFKKELRYVIVDEKGYSLGYIAKRDIMPISWRFFPNGEFTISSKQHRAIADMLDSLEELEGSASKGEKVALSDDAAILLADLKKTEGLLEVAIEDIGTYEKRLNALQKASREMRDPERKAVCDILANGKTFVYSEPGQEKARKSGRR